MFTNYVTVALRNLAKNKLFTLINIAGLVIGLMAMILANSLVNHEENYDTFFPDHERIHIINGLINPTKNVAIRFSIGIPSPVQPLIRANVSGVEYSARLWQSERVARVGENRFYQNMRFADPDFLNIFKLDFIAGDAATALASPDGLILSESAARKYFGDAPALGQSVTIDNRLDLSVTGVIKDLPRNSHFTNSILGPVAFECITGIEVYEELTGQDLTTLWGSTGAQNYTYVMLEEGANIDQVNGQLTQLHQTFLPEDNDFQVDYFLGPLSQIYSWAWDSLGIPVYQSIRILGILILLIAIFNYSNLTNAQYAKRVREIGLRKTLGSSRQQLLVQFLTESVAVTTAALIIALLLSVQLLEPLNDLAGKNFSLSGLFGPAGLVLLAAITLVTGVLGGVIPAFRISRTPAAACISDRGLAGSKGGKLRNIIVAVQFGIAIMLASSAAVIYAQNRYVETQSSLFDRDHIVLLDRVGRQGVAEKYETLKTELERLPGVISVTASNNVPYEQSNTSSTYARSQGDRAGEVELMRIYHDHDFMKTYEIPILAGRDFNRDVAFDVFPENLLNAEDSDPDQAGVVNVILNRIAVQRLGWDSPQDALDGRFYYSNSEPPYIEHRVAGVVDDFNYQGAISRIHPMMFLVRPALFETAAIRISGDSIHETVKEIDGIWNRLNPDFPLVRQFLDEQFNQIFKILNTLASILAGFALVAVFVAFIGLFGLSAFVAKSRTKEIGLRKVMGATVMKLMRLMVLQISVPVLIATLPAALLAWAGMNYGYLQAFSERIDTVFPYIVIAAVAVLVLSWLVVSANAWRVARASPIHALRYE